MIYKVTREINSVLLGIILKITLPITNSTSQISKQKLLVNYKKNYFKEMCLTEHL